MMIISEAGELDELDLECRNARVYVNTLAAQAKLRMNERADAWERKEYSEWSQN